MNFRSSFLSGAALLAAMTCAAAAPSEATLPPGPVVPAQSTNAPPSTPAPPQANAQSAPGAAAPNGANGLTPGGYPITKAPNTPPVTALPTPAATLPKTAAKKGQSLLDNYLGALDDQLKLTPEEKQDIETYYLADGLTLKNILNDDSLSPRQQARQVAVLREKRDAKIEALLADITRRHEFFQVEARYRVALIESAADGGLIPAGALAPVPAPTYITPGQAEPTPDAQHPVQ